MVVLLPFKQIGYLNDHFCNILNKLLQLVPSVTKHVHPVTVMSLLLYGQVTVPLDLNTTLLTQREEGILTFYTATYAY